MITLKKIKALDPCENRLDNYIKHYGERAFTKAQFMGLKHITQADKVWVAVRLMPKENVRFAVADIAESVLHIYEAKYPNDDRPRKTIEAARAVPFNDATVATTAANATYAAYAAARAATEAATYAARAATYAARSATYAATYAARAATEAAPNRKAQEKLIRRIILKYWKGYL